MTKTPLNEYWISWYHNPEYGTFELHTPWWISGYTMGEPQKSIIVGAVRAESEEEAWATVLASYDTPPEKVTERFCDPMKAPYPWDNPHGRFQRADWMQW